jgi:hypothetical protein
LILSDGKNRFKIKQGTSWWEMVFRGGSLVGIVNCIVTSFLVRDGSFYVISNSCGDAQSAAGTCDPGGGGGNKFELLDITEE